MNEFIRVWKEVDIKDISSHLLIVGDAAGDCSNCRTLGIDYLKAKNCPRCKTPFKYIASRTKEVRKIIIKRPDLIFIDLEDYKKTTSFIKAKELFGAR